VASAPLKHFLSPTISTILNLIQKNFFGTLSKLIRIPYIFSFYFNEIVINNF
jgi:hypothetical protein